MGVQRLSEVGQHKLQCRVHADHVCPVGAGKKEVLIKQQFKASLALTITSEIRQGLPTSILVPELSTTNLRRISYGECHHSTLPKTTR